MAQDNPFGDLISKKQGGIIAPSDPFKPASEQRAERGIDLEAERLALARREQQRRDELIASEKAKAEADARKATIEADRAAAEAQKAPSPQTGMIQQQLQTDSVLQLLNKARQQIGEGWNTGNVFGSKAFQGVPFLGQGATDLDTTLTGIGGNVIKDVLAQLKAQSSTGASGFGSLTEREGQLLQSSIAALQQKQSEGSLLENLARVERHYRNALALINKEDPRQEAVQEKYGILPPRDDGELPGANPPGGGGQVTSEGNAGIDPALKGLNETVSRMVRRGKSAEEIRAYLNTVRPGMGDAAQDVEAAVSYGRQNPDKPIGVDLEKVWKPSGGMSQTLGDIGMSPWGSGVIGAADVLSGGLVDNMTANPELTRATMEGVQAENPWSYLGGQLAGGAMTGAGAEYALGRFGLGAANSMRAGDLATGAYYGAGSADEPEQSRISSGALSAIGGLGGGMLGRAASRAGGVALSGVRDDAVRALDNVGIRMTPGQIMGGGLKRTEDRLAGLPVVGDQIRARQTEGIADFNRAAMAEAVAPIGALAPSQIGQGGVNANQNAISQAYDAALSGRQFQADPQFEQEIAAALAYGRAIPQLGEQFGAAVDNRVGSLFGDNGEITGNGFQDAIQGIRKASGAASNEVMSNEFDQGIGMVEDGLRGLVNRQAPDVVPAYDAANAAYRNQSVVDDAVLRALNQGGTFTPAQLGMSARSNTVKFGGKRAAARGDLPFNDLQQAAQSILPSQIPDSGTTGRAVIPALAFAAGGGGGYAASDGSTAERAGAGAGTALIASLLAAAPYSPAARNAVQRILLAERPETFQRAGDIMINNDTIAGLLASPTSYLALSSDK